MEADLYYDTFSVSNVPCAFGYYNNTIGIENNGIGIGIGNMNVNMNVNDNVNDNGNDNFNDSNNEDSNSNSNDVNSVN